MILHANGENFTRGENLEEHGRREAGGGKREVQVQGGQA